MTRYEQDLMWACQDCGHDTNAMHEYYMVHDNVWCTAVTPEQHAHMLCIGCLEARLDRHLKAEDFMNIRLNYERGWQRRSLLLQHRLRRQ